jgi:hypothetical protein
MQTCNEVPIHRKFRFREERVNNQICFVIVQSQFPSENWLKIIFKYIIFFTYYHPWISWLTKRHMAEVLSQDIHPLQKYYIADEIIKKAG